MRPKTTKRPDTDIWSQPASRNGELSTLKPPRQPGAAQLDVEREIAALIAPYQSAITRETLRKIVD
jgi:hypothetical protein